MWLEFDGIEITNIIPIIDVINDNMEYIKTEIMRDRSSILENIINSFTNEATEQLLFLFIMVYDKCIYNVDGSEHDDKF